MTSSGIPSPEREEVSVDGISIKGKADRKASEVKAKHPAFDANTDADSKEKKTADPKSETKTKGGREASLAPEETPGDLEGLRNRLAEQEKLAAEYLDLLKRKQADFENFRKRSQKEIDEYKRYATTEVVLDVLNLIDNFERAVESARSSKEFDALLEGVLIIKKQFRNLLEKKYGVKNIEAVGKEFDPNLHDAVMVAETGEYDKDTVIEDLQKGYVMHDRVIRPSKVKVAKAAESTADRGGDGTPGVSPRSPSRGASPGGQADGAADDSEDSNERG
jgi:molecular chaperone GrpE